MQIIGVDTERSRRLGVIPVIPFQRRPDQLPVGDDSPAWALLDPFAKCSQLFLEPYRFPLLHILPV